MVLFFLYRASFRPFVGAWIRLVSVTSPRRMTERETNGAHRVHPCDVTEINLAVNDRAHSRRDKEA